MKQFISAEACGKLMILGEHAVVYGFPCIVASVNKYLKVKGKKTKAAKDTFLTGKVKDTSFLKEAITVVRDKYGLKEKIFLETESELGEFGLGSSAATVVATVKTLDKLFGLGLTREELFSLSYEAVRKLQPQASGFDIAASIYGGTLYFNGGNKGIKSLTTTSLPIIVAFSGFKADTVKMVRKVAKLREENPRFVYEIFLSIAKLVEKGKRAIPQKDWFTFGKLMNKNHQLLTRLGVSTDKLDSLVKSAVSAGALGAKLSGAGGGDCLIALVTSSRQKQVEKAIREEGGKIISTLVGLGKGVV